MHDILGHCCISVWNWIVTVGKVPCCACCVQTKRDWWVTVGDILGTVITEPLAFSVLREINRTAILDFCTTDFGYLGDWVNLLGGSPRRPRNPGKMDILQEENASARGGGDFHALKSWWGRPVWQDRELWPMTFGRRNRQLRRTTRIPQGNSGRSL